MTTKNRNKSHARLIQDATGDSYAKCLQRVRDHEDFLQRTYGSVEAFDLSEQLAAWAVDQAIGGYARAVLPVGSPITVRYEVQAIGQRGIEVRDPVSGWWLDLASIDFFTGFWWRKPSSVEYIAMANFVHGERRDVGGTVAWQPLTTAVVARGDGDAVAEMKAAVTWLVGQFAAHPDRYDDTGRPASVEPPIFD